MYIINTLHIIIYISTYTSKTAQYGFFCMNIYCRPLKRLIENIYFDLRVYRFTQIEHTKIFFNYIKQIDILFCNICLRLKIQHVNASNRVGATDSYGCYSNKHENIKL